MDSVGSELATAERDRLTSADKIQTLDESLTQTSAALDHAVRPTGLALPRTKLPYHRHRGAAFHGRDIMLLVCCM
jgi:hypothetical protein